MQQEDEDSIYIAETGMTISGPYYDMWKSADDPFVVFGYPISNVMNHMMEPGVQVQYFQRARMDYDPSKPEGEQLTIAELGRFNYNDANKGEDAHVYTNNAACRFFEETQLSVCYSFLQFYDAHNGEVFFGPPISDVRLIDGRLVQYFLRAKMEWRPENLPGRRVKLAELGQLEYDLRGPLDNINNAPPRTVSDITVNIFPVRPLVGTGQTQSLQVVVQDQNRRAYEGARIRATAEYPDGQLVSLEAQITDAYGMALLDNIHTTGVRPTQLIKVHVEVGVEEFADSIHETVLFRVWW